MQATEGRRARYGLRDRAGPLLGLSARRQGAAAQKYAPFAHCASEPHALHANRDVSERSHHSSKECTGQHAAWPAYCLVVGVQLRQRSGISSTLPPAARLTWNLCCANGRCAASAAIAAAARRLRNADPAASLAACFCLAGVKSLPYSCTVQTRAHCCLMCSPFRPDIWHTRLLQPF